MTVKELIQKLKESRFANVCFWFGLCLLAAIISEYLIEVYI